MTTLFVNEVKNQSIDIGDMDRYHFEFLQPILEHKRFVFLGESSHCVKEYSLAKVSLIKYLHEELGFHVLAFESELGPCMIGDYLSDQLDSKRFMAGTIGRVWQNEFVLGLFDYMKKMKQERPLYFTGVDVYQGKKENLFSEFLESYLTGPTKQKFIDFEKRAIEVLIAADKRKIKRSMRQNIREEMESKGMELIEELKQHCFPDSKIYKIVLRTMENRVNYLKATLEKSFSKLFEYRDALMAKNLEFLAQEIYPNEKFIIWAHNMHISKNTSAKRLSAYKSFVENLSQTIKEKSFVLGLYAKEGKMLDYTGKEYPIKKTNKKHLESLLDHSPYQNSFIQCNGNWAQKKWRAYEGGGMPTSFVPAQQYDGILFFKYVSPAYFDVSERNREE
ncbi:erythromycin esterase family protein [Parageobacillus toebii]|nr:erythromycin esterase family protein [Parageobacillus toebii]